VAYSAALSSRPEAGLVGWRLGRPRVGRRLVWPGLGLGLGLVRYAGSLKAWLEKSRRSGYYTRADERTGAQKGCAGVGLLSIQAITPCRTAGINDKKNRPRQIWATEQRLG
jgi:hypothetical protein